RLRVPHARPRPPRAALRLGGQRGSAPPRRLMTPPRPHDLLGTGDAFAGRRVLVVGDVMLDHFLVGRVHRLSPEAPVPVVMHDHDEYRAGGAANVALNVAALGAHASLVGVVGADEAGARLQQMLDDAGVATDGLVVDETRPTTRKMRVVTARQQQVARVDYEADDEVNGRAAQRVA